MPVQMHTFRRGATYTWRKRLPSRLGGGVMQISLRTNEPLIARRLAMIMSAESCAVIDAMMSRGLSKDDARKLLVAVIEREHERIRLMRIAASEDTNPLSYQRNEKMDWAMGQALALLGQRGASAAGITEADRDTFRSAGKTDADIHAVETNIKLELPAFTQEPGAGLNARPFRIMKEALDRKTFSAMELLEGRLIYYKGRGAAFLASDRDEVEAEASRGLATHTLKSHHRPAHVSIVSADRPSDSESKRFPGHGHCEAARHFRVSPKFVNDLMKLRRETGLLTPKRQGNGGGQGKLAGVAGWLKARVTAKGELTLDELVAELTQTHGIAVHRAAVWHVLRGLGLTHKKSPAGA